MSGLLITNATMVNEGRQQELDVMIRNGRIEKIGASLSASATDNVIDATGLFLLPGMIDDQVHFREPGDGRKGTIASESRAAVAGGITSFMEMPNTNPTTTTRERLAEKYHRASTKSLANYAFYMGASNDNLEEIQRLAPGEACGVKVFMGASTGNMLVDDPDVLQRIFSDSPILIATHCEDTPTILKNEQIYRERYGEDVPFEAHPAIRSEEACYLSSSMAVELARTHDTRLHVLHLTTAKELSLFDKGPVAGKRITAEACVHHLWFDDSDYPDKGALIKCNPAVKTVQDRDALRQAVIDDVIDVIATDHAPHTWEEKQQTYFKSPAGLPLVQHAMLSLLDLVHEGILTLEQMVHKTSHAVAECYGVAERGYVREGYWADLVLVDLNARTEVRDDNILYRCGWSPFSGHVFQSTISTTIVGGQILWDGEKIHDGFLGQRLEFNQT
ncbi:MAG: dihydroorotase [Gammaproteobacteria bacterium]|nr:MAG: dihydroorotase [Gammaproteobacteria bacterium]